MYSRWSERASADQDCVVEKARERGRGAALFCLRFQPWGGPVFPQACVDFVRDSGAGFRVETNVFQKRRLSCKSLRGRFNGQIGVASLLHQAFSRARAPQGGGPQAEAKLVPVAVPLKYISRRCPRRGLKAKHRFLSFKQHATQKVCKRDIGRKLPLQEKSKKDCPPQENENGRTAGKNAFREYGLYKVGQGKEFFFVLCQIKEKQNIHPAFLIFPSG